MQGVGGIWEFFEDFPKPIFSESLKHQALDSSINSEGFPFVLVIWTIDGYSGYFHLQECFLIPPGALAGFLPLESKNRCKASLIG